ncbi:MAG: hypothetical protein KDC88_11505 [Ignavibacteriae bacterium]|nr:hypothetical protein [Ignavibacteriota bacterium]MCB9205969.1 hypothetical protein [Ignavibacteriales bacterium]MCB9209246.1 hypothetical protein [Ignavibacteriales bacterium]MCB9257888.1 hypothetical protein [Ignavibacteriales bacterium]
MSKIKLLISLIIISLVLINCADSNSTTNEPEDINDYSDNISEFFPVNVGNSFKYNVDTLNSSTSNYENLGTRQVTVSNHGTESNYDYFLCDEAYNLKESIFSSFSKFKITENSLEFYADTAGINSLIPDSLDMEISLNLDETFLLVSYPFENAGEWTAYKGSINFGAFKLNIITALGQYVGKEAVQLSELSKTVNAEKFKYSISINFPDINNPLSSNFKNYEAYVWFSQEYGVVKLEGCALFINPITGNKFNESDSNKVIRHTLISAN